MKTIKLTNGEISSLCMLSLATVQADRRTSDAAADAVQAYYQADCRAEEILAQLRAGAVPDGVTLSDGVYSYACTVSDTQELQVQVRVNGADYTVLQWQEVYTGDWTPDDHLRVWDGDTPQ